MVNVGIWHVDLCIVPRAVKECCLERSLGVISHNQDRKLRTLILELVILKYSVFFDYKMDSFEKSKTRFEW